MRAWNIFWRAGKSRWVLKYAPDWPQKVIPPEVAGGPKARRAAEAWAMKYVADLDAPPAPPPPPPDPTIAELVPRFLALVCDDERKAQSTTDNYKNHLDLSILPALGDLRPAELDSSHLRKLIRTMRKALGASTVRNRYATVKVLLRTIAGEKWAKVDLSLIEDPAVIAELPKLPIYKRIVLQPEAFGRLLECSRVPAVARLRDLFGASQGMCDGEIAGLKVADVAGGITRITKAVALRGREGHATENPTKNRYRVREIPQHPALVEAIAWWVAEGFELHVCRPPRPDDWFLPNPEGNPWRPKSAEALREHLELAGVEYPPGFQFHHLRACFSTWLEQTGASGECRARLLGHAPKTTAAAHYTGQLLAEDAQAIARLPIPIVDLGAGLGVTGARAAPNHAETSTPGKNRTCDLRFRKQIELPPSGATPRVRAKNAPAEARASTPAIGRKAASGLRSGVVLVPDPKALPPELHELKGALRGLRTWDAAEATLEGLLPEDAR